jgi:DivIVA domain-containing protein
MKLTPLDIRKQEFEKSLRGYDPSEVRNFLGIVATQWEEIADERRRLEDKVSDLHNKLEHYERVEEALQEALQTARENAEDKIKNAEREAELIVNEAKAEAREIRQEAKEERDQLQRRTQRIDDRRGEIVARLRSFLMAEMELLARFEGDDPIGFIKLLPTEERKKLREAGVDLEQISPHFEEVAESDTEAPGAEDADPSALDEELFGEGADGASSDADEPRMTPEEEDELSAFFEEFASGGETEQSADTDTPHSQEPADERPPADDAPPMDPADPEQAAGSSFAEGEFAEGEAEDDASDGAEEPFASSDDASADQSQTRQQPAPGSMDDDAQSATDPSAPGSSGDWSEFAPPEEDSGPEGASAHEPTEEDMQSIGEGWASSGAESTLNLDEIATSDQFSDQPLDEPRPGAGEDESESATAASASPRAEPPVSEAEPEHSIEDEHPASEAPTDVPASFSASDQPDAPEEPSAPDDSFSATSSTGSWTDEPDEPAPASSEPDQEVGGPASQPEAEPQSEADRAIGSGDDAAGPREADREFRVNSLFSADPDTPSAAPDTPSGQAEDAPEAASSTEEAEEEPGDAKVQDDDRDAERPSTSSEEIERIRRILKNMD